jgi:diaminopimelate decarboxylase
MTTPQFPVEPVSLPALADQFGTPLYVYHQPALIDAARALDLSLAGPTPHLICYALKANPTLAVIQTFARLGLGADVTSGGELFRARRAGVSPEKIVFSGVGKTPAEMAQALDAGIRALHVESEGELSTLAEIATQRGEIAPIALRVNPDVDPRTHPHIATGLRESKFGLPWESIPALVAQIRSTPSLRLVGLSVHIGSQIVEPGPFREAAVRVTALSRDLLTQGVALEYLDFGGGLAVCYEDESPPTLAEWGSALRAALDDLPLALLVEPGRSLVANAGLLLTRVLAIKRHPDKNFVVVDAGMNDLLRPALYDAYHPIVSVTPRRDAPEEHVDVVGPVCESTDALAHARLLSMPQPGDLLAVLQTGAYGSSMASNYNSRPRPAEVMILANGEPCLIRTRESHADLVRGESLLD